MKKALESLYDRTVDVYEYKLVTKANKAKGKELIKVIESVPCRISYSTIAASEQTDTAAGVIQVVKLIMDPEHRIKEGSKIEVKKIDNIDYFESSGKPAIYDSHQEIILKPVKKWA